MANSNNRNSNNRNSNNRNSNSNASKPRDDRRGAPDRNRGSQDANKMKICYNISQRGERSYWTRIGVAFVNSDGSLNVKLDMLPINGEMNIRDYVSREEFGDDEDDTEGE